MALTLSQEDLTALTESLKPLITEIASQSAASHVTKRNEAFEKKFDSKLEQYVPKPPPQEDEQEKITAKEDIRRLREELKAERESGARKEMRSALEAQLLKTGVPASTLKAVVAQLIHEDKLVSLNKEGKAVFKSAEYADETVSLEDGVSQWAKGEGKVFIPEPVARGAGLRPMRASSPSEQGESQDDLDRALFRNIKDRF